MKIQPIVYTWSGTAMVPLPRYQRVAERQFTIGEEYALQQIEERSMASHNQYFAAIHSGFTNLPEKYAHEFPTENHLRRWLLIEEGWFEQKDFTMPTEEAARELALWSRSRDEYARVGFDPENKKRVIVRWAKSQSLSAMGKADFEASKKACLDKLEAIINVPHGSLRKEAGRSA